MKPSRKPLLILIIIMLIGVFISQTQRIFAQQSANPIEAAWEYAETVGKYSFITKIVQTSRPLPTLANIGASSSTNQLYIEGDIDKTADFMQMSLYSQGGSSELGQGAVELKVKNGRSYGRLSGGEWELVENVTNFFAPDQDPMGFLRAATNITEQESSQFGNISTTRYSFDIDSIAFAQQMRLQMETELRQQGKLPPSVQLSVAQQYVDMTGSGEMWIDDNGRPLRQIIRLQFPPGEQEQVDAEIITDFNNWGERPVSQTLPALISNTQQQIQLQTETYLAEILLVIAGIALISLLVVRQRQNNRRRHLRRRRLPLYPFLAIAITFATLANPLLQSRQLNAFNEYVASSYAQPSPSEPAISTLSTTNGRFNPNQNPLSVPKRPLAAPNLIPLMQTDSGSNNIIVDDGIDSDGDGLTDTQEVEFYGTDPNNPDSDGDSLNDGLEISELGTSPLQADSDGDGLTDAAEIRGFVAADSSQWYLNPLAQSSGNNDLPDSISCTENGSQQLTCIDSDGDNVPDVFDLDDDNDGVPDTVDTAVTVLIGDTTTGLTDQTFQFALDGVAANESIFVDFQLRPTNPDNLWYSLSILDWPINDRSGQVQRVLDTPFGSSGSAANGDMRLIPMLEVEMSGTPLPLPLTNPQTSITVSDVATGTVAFVQQGADIELSFALTAGPAYTAEIYNASCANITDTSTPTYQFANVSNGSLETVAAASLAQDLADGSYALRLTDVNGETVCRAIPNIVNGSYSDKMVDADALAVYGIAAREKDNVGTIIAMVPLVLQYEEEGNAPVAFNGRMYYEPETADFGAVQQTRLLWMVQAKTDSCTAVPDSFDADPNRTNETEAERIKIWCSNNANWSEGPPSIIHAYYDDYYLTGLDVQRNLGMETAVIYEDPTYTAAQPNFDPNGFNDDNLWTLAQGLDVSLLSGRSSDTISRDLTINDLQDRWDKNSNGAATADSRWDIPQDALFVERFDYDSETGLGDLSQTVAYDILDAQFTSQAIGGIQDPTLLFLRETRIRTISIEVTDLTTNIGSNGLTLTVDDPIQSPESTIAAMNWVPYQYNGSGWQTYPLDDYWTDKGADIDAVLATYLTTAEVEGATLFARSFYIAVAGGTAKLVQFGDQLSNNPSSLTDLQMRDYLRPNAAPLTIGESIKVIAESALTTFGAFFGDSFLAGEGGGILVPSNLAGDIQSTLIGQKRQAVDFGTGGITFENIRDAYGNRQDLLSTDKINSITKTARWGDRLATASLGFAVAGAAASFIAAGYAIGGNESAAQIISIVAQGIAIVANALGVASLVFMIAAASAAKMLKSMIKTISLSAGVAIFFAVGIGISVGFFIYQVAASAILFGSLAFNQLLAGLIASIIVAVILFAIGVIPLVGQIIVAIIALIDAIVGFVCLVTTPDGTATDAEFRDYVCGGISGLLTKFVEWTIYDQTPAIELARTDRLNLTNFQFDVLDPTLGFAAGNQLTPQVDVQSALYINDVDDVKEFSPFNIYRWQFTDEVLKSSTLAYDLDSDSMQDLGSGLTLGQISTEWQPPQPDGFAPSSNFLISRTITNTSAPFSAGINQPVPTFLTEGLAYYTQECVMIPGGPTCWLRQANDTLNVDLTPIFTFDIFPATVAEFHQLTARDNGSFALAWDAKFPPLQDADGDGLRSPAFGGIDPDDSTPDSDADGLSDFYEIQQSASNPLVADSDGDGLCDGQEIQFNTDPNRADTDGDGLRDGEEVLHQDICDGDGDGDVDEWLGGWLFVYAFSGNTPLTTLVTSDPLAANADGDAYLDSQEKTYGFNPNVPSSGNILSLESTIVNGDNVVLPNSTVQYSVTLANELRVSHALGLLDVEFDASSGSETLLPTAFNLAPGQSENSDGSVTVAAVTQSQVVTLTNVAGALIVNPLEAVDGRSLWLKFNSPSFFADDSLNNWTVSCATCPFAVDGYRREGVDFQQNDFLELPDGAQNIGLTANGFTADFWIQPVAGSTSLHLLSAGSVRLIISNGMLTLTDGATSWTATQGFTSGGNWYRVSWRYDNATQQSDVFLDGVIVLSVNYDFGPSLEAAADASVFISGTTLWGSGAVLDELSIYPFPLEDSQILAAAQERVFYLQAEDNFTGQPSSINDDSAFENRINCEEIIGESASCPGSFNNNDGIIDNYFSFDNNSGEINAVPLEVAPNPNLDLSRNGGEFTITLWADPTAGSGLAGETWVMGQGVSSYGYPSLQLTRLTGGDPDLLRINGGIENAVGDECEFSATAVADSGWRHIAVSFDGSRFRVYVDNVETAVQHQVNNVDAANCGGITPQSGEQFFVGGKDGFYYGGRLDELQIFNYALGTGQIADIYWDELPILDYRLDEPPASDIFADRSLSSFDATCALCPLSGLPGRDNQAAFFDGVDDALAIPADTQQLGMVNSSFTLSAWINPRSASGQSGVIGNANASDAANELFLGLNGTQPQFTMGGSTITGINSVSLNEWTQLTAVYQYDSNTPSNSSLGFFVNGNWIGGGLNIPPLTAANLLSLGRTESDYFDGMIDSVQIYRKALTNAEVADLVLQAPVVNLHLNEAQGATTFANDGNPALTASCSGAGCPQTGIKGRMYQAVMLDGQTDIISIPDTNNLLDLDRFSIGMWVNPTQQRDGWQTLISKGQNNIDRSWALAIPPNSMQLMASVGPVGCVGFDMVYSVGSMTENMWNYVMMVYDDQAAEMRLYINGSLDTTQSVSSPICVSDEPVRLGDNLVDYPFAGGMDELVIYPSVLSDRDVEELFRYQQAWYDTRVEHRIVIDAENPTVALDVTAPYLPNYDKVLAILAADPTSEVVLVEYNVNGGGWQTAVSDINSWLFTFIPGGEGDYTIDLRATDEAGNVGTSSSVVAVDGSGPMLGALNVEGVTAVSIQRNAANDSWDVALSGSVSASGSPLDSVTVELFDDVGDSVGGRLETAVSGSSWSLGYPFLIRPNGVFTVSVQATDLIGNLTERVITANIDGTPPDATMSVSSVVNYFIDANATISGSITETGGIVSGIQSVEIGYHPLGENDRSGVQDLDGVVVHLPLNEASDPSSPGIITRFEDASGNGRYATCINCPATGVTGMLGYAPNFDGVDDRLQVADLGDEIGGSATSFGAWIYPNAPGGGSADIALLALDNMSLRLRYGSGGNPRLAFGTTEATPLLWDEWAYVMVTIADDDSGVLYINGTAAATFSTTSRPNANSFLQIGTAFDGQIDDVVVFSRALTGDEAAGLHRRSYPVFNLPFDDVQFSDGVPIDEASRFAHVATWQGGGTLIGRPVPGAVGNGALAFDGAATQINVAANAALDLSDGLFTQMAWIYPQNSGGPIIDSVTDAAGLDSAYPFMNVVNGRHLQIGFGDGSSFASYTSGDLLTPDAWNFVAVTFDGTTYSIYVDGQLQETTAQFAGTVPAATSQFNVGTRNDGTGADYFDGMLDEIVIYRQVLSAERIAALLWQGWNPVSVDASGAGVPTANWTATVPDGLLGSYQVQLRTSDVNGNVSLDHNEVGRWSGYIDPETVNIPVYEIFLPIIANNYAAAPDLVVESIVAAGGTVSVVIGNVGETAVTDEFWVDLYLNPNSAPTAVNQTWPTVGSQGAVWGIEGNVLPLLPGESITLTVDDAYYWSTLSNLPTSIPSGAQIYVQVDSANATTTYGAVLENHEQNGGVYNNIGNVTALAVLVMERERVGETAVTFSALSLLPDRP